MKWLSNFISWCCDKKYNSGYKFGKAHCKLVEMKKEIRGEKPKKESLYNLNKMMENFPGGFYGDGIKQALIDYNEAL